MNSYEIGKEFCQLCQQGKNMEAIEKLYSPEIKSIEAQSMENMPKEQHGMDAIKKKNQWWLENHEVHSVSLKGPYPNGDQFSVFYDYDVTNKTQNKRVQMQEVGLYTVKDNKIVKEEYFYHMG